MASKRTPPQHWFTNPTEQAAIRNTERKEWQAIPKIYICSPYKGDIEKNTANAIRYCRVAVDRGCFPIAPHVFLPQFLNDDNPAERELALSFGIRLLGGCKEIWVVGSNITEGMKREINAAIKREITVKHFNEKMEEIRYD